MTREEHIDIRAFIDRVVGGEQPPLDVEADAIIRALFVRNPDAAYRMTILARSLAEAQLTVAPVPAAPKRVSRTRPRGLWISSLFKRRRYSRHEPHGALRS